MHRYEQWRGKGEASFKQSASHVDKLEVEHAASTCSHATLWARELSQCTVCGELEPVGDSFGELGMPRLCSIINVLGEWHGDDSEPKPLTISAHECTSELTIIAKRNLGVLPDTPEILVHL